MEILAIPTTSEGVGIQRSALHTNKKIRRLRRTGEGRLPKSYIPDPISHSPDIEIHDDQVVIGRSYSQIIRRPQIDHNVVI